MPIDVKEIMKVGAAMKNSNSVATPPPLNKVQPSQSDQVNKEAQKESALTGKVISTQYPYEEVELPSKGYFYPENSPLSSGKLDIKLMTAREEDILTSINLIRKNVQLDRLLDALILTPGVKHEDLIITDKNALLIYVRILAYGEDYHTKISCPSCYAEIDYNIKLSFPHKEFDFTKFTKGVNRFEFQLPFSKKNLVIKLLTGKDDNIINSELKSLEKLGNSSKSELSTKLKHMILSVDDNSDKAYIRNFVNDMLAKDSLALRQYIKSITPELNLEFPFTCSKCGHEEGMMLPFGASFFYPDTRV